MNKNFKFKYEELPAVSDWVKSAFVRDLSSFTGFSAEYSDGFLNNYEQSHQAMKEVVEPRQLSLELNAVTTKLYHLLLDQIQTEIDYLKRQAERAESNLTNPVKKWFFTEAKNSARSKDTESVVKYLKNILALIDKNLSALQEKGYTTEKRQVFVNIKDQIETLSATQNEMFSKRKRLVEDNITLLNQHWTLVNDVLRTGKVIFKRTSKAKTDDYTLTTILSHIKAAKKASEAEETESAEQSETTEKAEQTT